MADVYRGKLLGVEGFEKDVAVKKILPYWSANREFVDMLIDEAKVLLYLTHPNIVQVFELNKEEETYFLVMEYVDGVDLRRLTSTLSERGEVVPVSLAVFISQQICHGLQYAHEKKDRHSKAMGIVHRDISPQNILLSADGEVKITDFGIAKVMGKTTETVTGTLKGKFAYMSPEQALGQTVDARCDIFALGIILYEMVTGERAFKGANDLETLESVKNAEVVFPFVARGLPKELKEIIGACLKKEKEKRYSSISELREALRKLEQNMGYLVSPSDLRAYLYDVMPERFAHRREREEDLSQKTRLHLKTATGVPPERKTKILVGPQAPSGSVTYSKTWYHQVKTFILEKTLLTASLVPPKIKSYKGRILVAGALLALTLAFIPFLNRDAPLPPAPTVLVEPVPTPPALEAPKPTVPAAPNPPVTAKAATGKIEVVSQPPDADIHLLYDGKKFERKGKFELDLPFVGRKEIAISVAKEGFVTVNKVVILTAENPIFRDSIELKKELFGALSVAAKPWGKVFLPGVVSGSETPFTRQKIPVGDYQLRVFFPPQQKSLTAQIVVSEGGFLRCQAVFGEASGLTCR